MSQPSAAASAPLTARLRATPAAQRQRMLLDVLGESVHRMLGPASGTVPRVLGLDDRMFELGLSSLLVAEFKSRLEDECGIELPLTLFFVHASLGTLTEHLLSELLRADAGAVESSVPQRAAPAGVAPAPGSVSELEAELAQKLADLERKYGL